nr:Rieske (2Fe-2S) protein [Nocardioides daedukensis]
MGAAPANKEIAVEPSTCLSRRRALGGAAVVGVGVPLLAACGGGSSDKPAAPDAGTVLAKTSDIEVGGGLILDEEKIVITQPTAGEFKAFSATCTHQGCLVTGVSTTIDCSCHNSAFAIADGSVAGGPAPEGLPEIAITVKGGQITAA